MKITLNETEANQAIEDYVRKNFPAYTHEVEVLEYLNSDGDYTDKKTQVIIGVCPIKAEPVAPAQPAAVAPVQAPCRVF